MTERLNGWLKVICVAVPLLVAAFIGWGALNARVSTLETAQVGKADAEVVNVQYEAILRELRTMNARLERLEARR